VGKLRATLDEALQVHPAGDRWAGMSAVCGLGGDERCLNFYRTEQAVQAASKPQVRQPIDHRSVGRWRAFAAHLEPLRQALGTSPGRHTDKNDTNWGLCHAG
jgi:hypothetical protein